MAGEGILKWVRDLFLESDSLAISSRIVAALVSEEELQKMFDSFTPEQQKNPAVKALYDTSKTILDARKNELRDPLAQFIQSTLGQWVAAVGNLEGLGPDQAKAKLSELSAKVIELFGASTAIDIALGTLPDGEGEVSSRNTKQLLKWLGFGAVLAAVAHDPVKIGLLRPYQDSLEATFRNRRPEYQGILNAYKQRSLSTIPITSIDEITDAVMDEVEADNNKNMDDYGAMWGYPQKWITIEKDAATRALTFGNLSSMARMGHYDRKMSIFSLWTYGLDRRLMVASLDALETMRDVGLWKGFRSMVEPGYVQGVIDEADLKEYWNRILVPLPVQEWTLLRLKKARERYAEKEAKTGLNKQRDLTRADFVKAYQTRVITLAVLKTKLKALGYDDEETDIIVKLSYADLTKADFAKAYIEGIIDLATFQAKLKELGYDVDEISIIVKLADAAKKIPAAAKCKRLSLSDYELAHKNGILTTDQVIARLTGEYCDADIEIERQLLALDDLTTDAPIRERDLSVSEITTAYIDDLVTKDRMTSYFKQIGYDDEEIGYLVGIADIKKEIADAKADKAAGKAAVVKDRDLTRADFTFEYVHNRISEEEYRVALTQLRYDKKETDVIVDIANVKKKIPSIEGLKHLPLTDYEKVYKKGFISLDDVLNSMRGTYTEADIQLERLGLLEGVL